MITLIAAHSSNNVIGKDGDLPWSIPGDLAFFKRETLGGAVIMGRRTWETFRGRPLPKRQNIVVTRSPGEEQEGLRFASSIEDAVTMCKDARYTRIYGIGGQGIYEAMMPYAERMVLSQVAIEIQGGDAFFPGFDRLSWKTRSEGVIPDEKYDVTYRELIRIRDWA